MKTPTRNKKQNNNVFNNTITDDKIKHVTNDAMKELKNINAVDMLPPLMYNCAIELIDWIDISVLEVMLPLLYVVFNVC